MSYCINPDCPQPKNPADAFLCQACGSRLLIRNRYRINKSLGQGGFGATFLAVDVSLPGEPICVIKQLRPSNNHEKFLRMARELFEREARTLGKIGNHPQIPRLLDYFEERKTFYLVQDYVAGHTLHQEVKQQGLFTEEKIRQFLVEILPIIEYIHTQNVIHRDIKPANIIRRQEDGKLVLIDFGAVKNHVSQAIDPYGSGQTALTNFAVGTSGYAPPEQLAMRPIFASDIYALGVTAVYLLTGKSPKDMEYSSTTGEMLWQQHIKLGKHLTQVLTKMLDVSVRHRYQSATEVLRALALEPHVNQLSTGLVNPPPPRPGLPGQNFAGGNSNLEGRSAAERMAIAIRQSREKRDPGNTKMNPDPTRVSTSNQSNSQPSSLNPMRQVRKLDTPAVRSAFSRGHRNFNDLDLSNLQLIKENLPGLTMENSNCSHINLTEANLSSGKFARTDFSHAILRNANFSKASLSYANLQGADLRGADLSNTYLNYANLSGANLSGANLSGAKINDEQLAQAKTNFMTIFPNGKRGGFW